VVLFAVIVHLLIFGNALNPDTTSYVDETKGLLTGGSLELAAPPFARHPPLMSLAFVPFALAFGYTEFSVHIFEMITLVGDLAVLYLLSLHLGRRFGVVPCLLLSIDPVFYLNMSEGRSLGLLILFAMVTLWGIWQGLSDSRWFVVAAVGASLGFLTADTFGYLFVAAGLLGLTWRYYYVGVRVFSDRGYISAAVLFLASVSGWSLYNMVTIGSPYTDPRVVGFLDRLLLTTPVHVFVVTVGGLASYFLLFLLAPAIPFLLFGEGRVALYRLPRQAVDDQRFGALLLFVLVAVSISAIVSAAFLLYEPLRSLASVDTYLRYVDVVAPMIYLVIGKHVHRVSLDRHVVRWAAPLAIAIVILSAQMAFKDSQGQASSEPFIEIRQLIDKAGGGVVYTDVVAFVAYNLPGITFVSIYMGVSTPSVNITAADVPVGSVVLTYIYMPRIFDQRVGGFFFINRFDPTTQSPFLNLAYST